MEAFGSVNMHSAKYSYTSVNVEVPTFSVLRESPYMYMLWIWLLFS